MAKIIFKDSGMKVPYKQEVEGVHLFEDLGGEVRITCPKTKAAYEIPYSPEAEFVYCTECGLDFSVNEMNELED